ncbi:transposase, partial [Kitasatospora phosalacinea]
MIAAMCVCACKPSYESSLTDGQWAVIEPLLPRRDPRKAGRPLKFSRRLVVDTVLYVLVSGC